MSTLTKLATSADTLTFKVAYRYSISGPLAGAVSAIFDVIQRPPDSIHHVQITTKGDKGRPVTVASWSVREGGRFYACTTYGQEVTCTPSAPPPGAFGFSQLDDVFAMARDPAALVSVEAARSVTIVGEKARCYVATPRPPTPVPVTSPMPRFTPTKFRFELCYSRDGIPLRVKRWVVEPVPTGVAGTASVLEATSVSRAVAAADLRLPGPVRGASALLSSPQASPTPAVGRKGK